MKLELFFILLFVSCSVALAQRTSPIPSAAQSRPTQDSSPSSPLAQEPSPSISPAVTPAPSGEEQGVQRVHNITILPGLITITVAPQTTPTPISPTITAFPKNIGSWSIQEEAKKTHCLMVNAAMQLHVIGNTSQNVPEFVVDVPSTHDYVTVEGDCGTDVQKLSISWYSNETGHNNLTLKFSKLGDIYGLSAVTYVYNFKHEAPKKAFVEASSFVTTVKKPYRCHSEQRMETDDGSLALLTFDLHFEAFRHDFMNSTVFSAADDCKADHRTSTAVLVGISVGVGLLICVCITLGIYLIKRFRNREGYQHLNSHKF